MPVIKRIDGNTRGVFAVVPTPFLPDGHLDLASIRRLCDFYLSHHVNGLTLLGLAGEAAKLSASESLVLINTVIKYIDGRIPVIVDVSGAGLDPLVTLAKQAMELGAAGLMIAPSSDLRTDEALIRYYGQLAKALPDMPICLHDCPQTSGVHFSVPVLESIFKRYQQICMLKHEDNAGLSKLSRFRALGDATIGRRVSVLVGNGALFLPHELARDADGAMVGFAYPDMLSKVCALHAAGQRREAADLFDVYLPLLRYELQPGLDLAIRKTLLCKRGAISHPYLRAPNATLNVRDRVEIDLLIKRLEQRLAQFDLPLVQSTANA